MYRKKQLFMLALNVTLLTLLMLPAAATAEDEKWRLRLAAAWVDPDVDFTHVDSDGDHVTVGADGEIGFGLALERRFSRRLGIELGVLFAEPDLDLDVELAGGMRLGASESVGFTAVTAGLNVHLTPDRAVDLYLAPLLVYATYDDLRFGFQVSGETLTVDFSSDDDFAFGAQLGADIPFGDGPWSLNLAARYLDTSLSVIDNEGVFSELKLDPLILSAGFSYRF